MTETANRNKTQNPARNLNIDLGGKVKLLDEMSVSYEKYLKKKVRKRL